MMTKTSTRMHPTRTKMKTRTATLKTARRTRRRRRPEMSTLLAIAKREFRSYFDSPLAYVVICLSFFGLGLMFFMYRGGFWQLDRATMEPLFEYVPAGLAILVVPVVTMRLMAEERRSGTLEMLITLPVRDSDVILGKFAGALGLVFTVIVASAAYPIL